MKITECTVDDLGQLGGLFSRLPAEDLTFVKEDTSPEALATWPGAPGWRWVARDDSGEIQGMIALIPLQGWSDHVGEVRLVVDTAARGAGVGRALANIALEAAARRGLRKVIVEVPADQERVIEMFVRLGFTGEALLRDHFRDRQGELRDLVMLAYLRDQTLEAIAAMGVAEAF